MSDEHRRELARKAGDGDLAAAKTVVAMIERERNPGADTVALWVAISVDDSAVEIAASLNGEAQFVAYGAHASADGRDLVIGLPGKWLACQHQRRPDEPLPVETPVTMGPST